MSTTRPPKRPLDLGSDDDTSSERPPAKRAAPSPPNAPGAATNDDDDDEDDYMSMAIAEPKPAIETLTERAKRKAREAEIRGRPKSKAELAAIEKEKREAALAKSLMDAEAEASNKGFKMMQKMGYKAGTGLGKKNSSGTEQDEEERKKWEKDNIRLEPVGVAMKEDRGGIGHVSAQQARIREAAAERARKEEATDPRDFRERQMAEREEKRCEGLFYAVQKVAEKLDSEKMFGEDMAGKERTVPLKNIPVVWRGWVRFRENREREKRMRFDMMTGMRERPGVDEDEEAVAMGRDLPLLREVKENGDKKKKEKGVEDDAEELMEEDQELEEFDELSFDEKLERAVEYLRKEHCYCFWCKYKYEDAGMDGCPGSDEDSHG